MTTTQAPDNLCPTLTIKDRNVPFSLFVGILEQTTNVTASSQLLQKIEKSLLAKSRAYQSFCNENPRDETPLYKVIETLPPDELSATVAEVQAIINGVMAGSKTTPAESRAMQEFCKGATRPSSSPTHVGGTPFRRTFLKAAGAGVIALAAGSGAVAQYHNTGEFPGLLTTVSALGALAAAGILTAERPDVEAVVKTLNTLNAGISRATTPAAGLG